MVSATSLKREFSWILVGNLFYAASQYLMLIGMVKLTTPVLVGQFSYALAVNAPIALFMSMSIRAVVISDSTNQFSQKVYLKLRSITALCTFTASAFFVLVTGQTGVSARVILLIALIKSVESFSDLIYGFMQKSANTHLIARSLILRGALSLILANGLLFWSGKIEWLCIGWLLATTIGVVFYDFRFMPRKAPEQKQSQLEPASSLQMKTLFLLALPLGIATVLSSLESNAPRYFIEGALGLSALGIFSALSYPVMLATQIVGSLAAAPAPRMAHLYQTGNYKEFKQLLYRVVSIAGGVSLVNFFVCLLFGRTLLTFINGPAYAAETATFVVLSLATGVGSIAIFFGAALSAMQRFLTKLVLQVLSLLTIVAASAYAASQKSLLSFAVALFAGAVVSLNAQVIAFYIEYRKRKRF